MRYPSMLMVRLADKLEEASETVAEWEMWAVGWKIWRYPKLSRRVESLENDKRLLMEEYANLAALYEEKTGETAPASFVMLSETALSLMRKALDELGKRMRALLSGEE